jgi:hypothetical protein
MKFDSWCNFSCAFTLDAFNALTDLRDAGVLTADEFTAAKAKLLGL